MWPAQRCYPARVHTTVTPERRRWLTAILVGLSFLVCVLASRGVGVAASESGPSETVASSAVTDMGGMVDAVGASATGALTMTMTMTMGAAVMDCGGMGAGGANACVAAVAVLVLSAVATALVLVLRGVGEEHSNRVQLTEGHAVSSTPAPPWTVLSLTQLSVSRV